MKQYPLQSYPRNFQPLSSQQLLGSKGTQGGYNYSQQISSPLQQNRENSQGVKQGSNKQLTNHINSIRTRIITLLLTIFISMLIVKLKSSLHQSVDLGTYSIVGRTQNAITYRTSSGDMITSIGKQPFPFYCSGTFSKRPRCELNSHNDFLIQIINLSISIQVVFISFSLIKRLYKVVTQHCCDGMKRKITERKIKQGVSSIYNQISQNQEQSSSAKKHIDCRYIFKLILKTLLTSLLVMICLSFITFTFLKVSELNGSYKTVCKCAILDQTSNSSRRVLQSGLQSELNINGNSSYVVIKSDCGAGLKDVSGAVWKVTPSVKTQCTQVNVSILESLEQTTCTACKVGQSLTCIPGENSIQNVIESNDFPHCWFGPLQVLTYVTYNGQSSSNWQFCIPVYQNSSVMRTFNGITTTEAATYSFTNDPVAQRPYGWITNGTYQIILNADNTTAYSSVAMGVTVEQMAKNHILQFTEQGAVLTQIMGLSAMPIVQPCSQTIVVRSNETFTQFQDNCESATCITDGVTYNFNTPGKETCIIRLSSQYAQNYSVTLQPGVSVSEVAITQWNCPGNICGASMRDVQCQENSRVKTLVSSTDSTGNGQQVVRISSSHPSHIILWCLMFVGIVVVTFVIIKQ